ncbi:MAG TPA: cupin domain-containing protein [Chryseolinea sp.]|nr:cupin domain-containing protein [Chryseolinea sp.]
MRTPEFWIEHLRLQQHPEGGYYRETYRSREEISVNDLANNFKGWRSASTAIYFLLTQKDRSLFHRIKSDELWHFHYGGPLNIYVLGERGLIKYTLGPDVENGESLQVAIPANHWFGAATAQNATYTLASCTVAPGFDFQDFEMAERKDLLTAFPKYEEIIIKLTKQ